MNINRVLTLAALFVAATILLYLSGPHRQLRQTRVYVGAMIPSQSDAEIAQATKYLRDACPDIILIKDQQRADYRLNAFWNGTSWFVLVGREALPWMFYKQDSPDAMDTFRRGCTAIRDDAKELADFDAHTPPMGIGRYSLHSTNPNQGVVNEEGRVFLLDTKTGAVWQLKPVGDTQEFERMSVEGLYKNRLR
jgi:hypothetical protein